MKRGVESEIIDAWNKRQSRFESVASASVAATAQPTSKVSALTGVAEVYEAFSKRSEAFFASDRKAREACEYMELDGPMADLRGSLVLLASGAKPCVLIAFGMRPDFATRLVEGLWRPFLAARPELAIELRQISRTCTPFESCPLEGQWIAFPKVGRSKAVDRAFFKGPTSGEELYARIGKALDYPHDSGFETDCRVEYFHSSHKAYSEERTFVLEYEAHSSNVAAIADHFLKCRRALAPVFPLRMAVDQIEMDPEALAEHAGDSDALETLWTDRGWTPDERLGQRDLDLCRGGDIPDDIDFS